MYSILGLSTVQRDISRCTVLRTTSIYILDICCLTNIYILDICCLTEIVFINVVIYIVLHPWFEILPHFGQKCVKRTRHM